MNKINAVKNYRIKLDLYDWILSSNKFGIEIFIEKFKGHQKSSKLNIKNIKNIKL